MHNEKSLKNMLFNAGMTAIFVFIVVLFSACDDSSSKHTVITKTPGTDNFSREEANQYLADLTKELTLQNPQTAKRLAKGNGLLQAPMLDKMLIREKLEAYEVNSDVPNEITVEGKPFAVRVESFNPDKVAKLSKSLDGDGVLFGIYADPANYYDGTSSEVRFPVQIISKENGEYVTTGETWSHPYAG